MGKHVRLYDPPKSRNWKATAQEHMRRAMLQREVHDIQCDMGEDCLCGLLEGPLTVQVTCLFSCPKTDYRKRTPRPRRWHAKRPDAENVAKAVLDAATGVVWRDDDQVARLVIRKVIARQGEAPGVWFSVAPLDEGPVEVP